MMMVGGNIFMHDLMWRGLTRSVSGRKVHFGSRESGMGICIRVFSRDPSDLYGLFPMCAVPPALRMV